MGEPIRLDFGTSSDTGRYGPDSGPLHENCFVEPVAEGKHPAPLYAMDGLENFATITNGGETRGLIVVGSKLYAVSGTVLAEIDSSGNVSEVGGIPGTADVSLARNDKPSSRQLVIAIDGNRLIYENGTLSTIDDEDIPPPVSVAFLNQRIIYAAADGTIVPSAVDEATDVSSLDEVAAEASPDALVGIVVHNQEVWAIGAESTQVFSDTGNSTAPLRPNSSLVIPKGCVERGTIASLDTDLFWVGNDLVVYRVRGGQLERISNHAVEKSIRETSDKSTLEAMAYNFGGHSFYVLSSNSFTWAYNRTTNTWSKRLSYQLTRWRAAHAVEFAGNIIVGDYSTNKLYKISRTAHDEAGNNLVWRARTAPMHAYPNQISCDELYLDFVMGVGTVSSDAHANAPKVGLRWSDDGGYSWSNQLFRDLGATGVKTARVTYAGLGSTQPTGRIWEVECSSPVIRCLMYAAVRGDKLVL
jgi:hypothetical protein